MPSTIPNYCFQFQIQFQITGSSSMTTEDQETSRTASTKPSYSIMHRPGYPHYPVPPSGHFGQYSQHHLLQPTASAGLDNGGIFLSNWLNHWLRFWFLRPWKFPLLGAKNASFCVKKYCTERAFNNFKFHLSLTNYLSGQLCAILHDT